jgi:hypothetical protein
VSKFKLNNINIMKAVAAKDLKLKKKMSDAV